MNNSRFDAIQNLTTGNADIKGYGDQRITSFFGCNVFTGKVAREYLSDEAYKSLMNSIRTGP
jgi:glutamine synthetase